MKKLIQQFLLICTILFVFSYNSYADTCNDKAYHTLKKSTVKLIMRVEEKDGVFEYFSCTGIIIDKDEKSTGILTAQHCVDIVEYVNDVTVDYKFPVSEIYESKLLDVAYLKVDQSIENKTAINIATYNAQDNESIYTLGYPNITQLYNCAKVLYSTTTRTYSNAKIIIGCSGSGVINGRGKLVGVMWGAYIKNKSSNVQTGASIMTNIESIRKFLYKIKVLNQNVTIK